MKALHATCLAISLTVISLLPPRAYADTWTFGLNLLNNTPPPVYSPSFAQVTIVQSGQTATITFDAINGYLFHSGNTADVNVNATTFTVGTFTSTPGALPGSNKNDLLQDKNGGTTVDGWGSFNLRTTVGKDGDNNQLMSQVSFVVTSTGGPVWSSAMDVLTPNGDSDCAGTLTGCIAAAHIVIPNSGGLTYFASGNEENSSLNVTPEPGTLLLVGSLLSGLGLFGRKRFLKIVKD